MNQPELMQTAPADVAPTAPEIPDIENVLRPLERKRGSSLTENRRLLVIGAGVAVVMLLLAFSGLSHKRVEVTHDRAAKQAASGPLTASDSAPPSSLTPIVEAGPIPLESSLDNSVDAAQLARTATGEKDSSTSTRFGPMPLPRSEERRSWQPPSYIESDAPSVGGASIPERDASPGQHESMNNSSQPSLVFVAKEASLALAGSAPNHPDPGVELPTGTRLRARLEAAVSSAVHTPVVAIVEYNYEQNGEIVIPAGARVTGHLEGAGRSGYVEIRFDSLSIPGMVPLRMEAIATDLRLRPLRGRVEGKNTGRNLLVRSAAGIGQIAATLAGRGNLDQPLSESDLLRERLSNNIGQAADQQVTGLTLSEQTVVTLAAGTEIYVVLEKLAIEKAHAEKAPPAATNQRSIEELRQLLRLQRELDQSSLAPVQ